MTHPPSASPALRPCHFVASRLRRARATGRGGRRPPQNGEFYARRSGSGGRQTLIPCHHQPTLLTASGWCTFRVPDWYTFRMPPATFDNGTEFADHETMAKTLSMDIFFAHPYHSWERGTNENTNGLIRRLHPKKSSFAKIDDEALRRIDRFLNDRPRKCLGWMTPREKMTLFMAHAP